MTVAERLLVPIDGSDGSERAMAHALAVAETTGATVDVLHVVDAGGLGSRLDPEVFHDRARTLVRTAERLAADVDVDTTTEIVSGRPHEAILETAAARESWLIVMGRRGEPGATARLLGGVTDKVLRGADRPVLAVPATDRAAPAAIAYEQLLLPTDGSELSFAAAPYAAALADPVGATVHVVSAVDAEAGLSGSIVDDLIVRAESAVAGMAERLPADGALAVETAVVRGRPHEALGTYVVDHDLDLVAMSTHGRSGVARWVLGSVTDRVVRTVDVPVLVVPSGG